MSPLERVAARRGLSERLAVPSFSGQIDTGVRPDSTSTPNPPSDGGAPWIADSGTWGVSAGWLYNSSATPGTNKLLTFDSFGCQLVRRDLGKTISSWQIDYGQVFSSFSGMVFAYDPAAGSGYCVYLDNGSFNGGISLSKVLSNGGANAQFGGAATPAIATPFAGGAGSPQTPIHTFRFKIVYDKKTGHIQVLVGVDGATPTVRIDATDASKLAGTSYGMFENHSNFAHSRWRNSIAQ